MRQRRSHVRQGRGHVRQGRDRERQRRDQDTTMGVKGATRSAEAATMCAKDATMRGKAATMCGEAATICGRAATMCAMAAPRPRPYGKVGGPGEMYGYPAKCTQTVRKIYGRSGVCSRKLQGSRAGETVSDISTSSLIHRTSLFFRVLISFS